MNYYVVWTNEYGEKMVEVFSDDNLIMAQKEFLDKGYIIKETFLGKDSNYFFVVEMIEQR